MRGKMKTSLLLAVVLCLLLAFPVSAAQTGSLQIDNVYASVTLFPLADAAGALTAEFSAASEPLTSQNTDATLAKQLQKFATEKGLSGQEKTPDASGRVFYDQLEEGFYLVCSLAQPGEFAPFILRIPTTVADKVIYDVQAEPKEDPSGETDEPEALPPLQPVIPQTGFVQWPKYLLLALGAACVVAGLFEAFRGREKRYE